MHALSRPLQSPKVSHDALVNSTGLAPVLGLRKALASPALLGPRGKYRALAG